MNALNKFQIIAIVCCICCGCPSLLAQRAKRNQLEVERKSLYKDIQTNRKLLQTTQSNKTTSLNELNLLQNQINSREKMINLIEQEINLLDMSITQATQHIDSLNQTLDILKHEYAEMVRQAYLTENTHTRLLFLFSAKNMNEKEVYKWSKLWAALWILVFAVTESFASWDYVMCIDPHWYSTLF
ncbi:MAG TPA: hypothetical protein PK230_03475, partial [Chitinophagales bacterium]|nr:hypothetical protein [Chitinophagales bacterium]